MEEAIKLFGKAKVDEVMNIVNISDPDFAYVTFEDQGDEDAVSIIEMIYFEEGYEGPGR